MNWLTHLLHAVGKMLGGAAAVAAAATGGPGGPVATGSISAGMQAGPSCVTRTMQPGDLATVYFSVVNPNHSGWEKLDMSADRNGSALAADLTPPRSWLTLPGPQWVGPGASARVPVTVTVPSGARRGRYGATVIVTAYAPQSGGSGTQVAFGAGAGAFLEFSVGVSAPPAAFCTGRRDTYWRTWPRLPVCRPGQVPVEGRQAMCRVLPLPPPVASARDCRMSSGKWARYIRQLERAGRRYAHNASAYLGDAHCTVGGHMLNTASYNRRTGAYRSTGGGAPRFTEGQIQDARPAVGP